MLPRLKERRGRVLQGAGAIAALLLLNGALTFHNLWPTLGVYWPGELSVEIAAVLLVLVISNAWLGHTAARVIALLSALVVLFALGRYGAVTAPALYGREVNLYWDAPRLVSVVEMLGNVASAAQIAAVCGGAALVLTLLYLLARWSLRQLDGALREFDSMRPWVGGCCALLLAVFFAQQYSDDVPRIPRFSIPVSGVYAGQIGHVVDALSSERAAQLLPPSPQLHSNLQALCGSDVLLVFLESYGSVTYDRPEYEQLLEPARDRLAHAVRETGRGVVSAFVESPTFAGQSVLAHLTLLTGIEVRDSTRYTLLMTQKRPTLISAFRNAGYKAVAIMPGMQQDWPEGAFYGFDDIYDAAKLQYRGPTFGWWRIPDQYTLAELDSRELRRQQPRQPVLVFFPTVSTHIPFRPIPPIQPDWTRVLSAQPYDADPLQHAFAQRPDWTAMGKSYVSSVDYFLSVLASYLRGRADENLLLIVLGDHQPAASVSGEGAPWDVPVHIITNHKDVLEKLQQQGFRDGVMPVRPAIGKMNELTKVLLDAFNGVGKCMQPESSMPQAARLGPGK